MGKTIILNSTIPEPAEMSTEIRGATLKDDFCNYTYELKNGPTAGDSVKRSGASIVHDDLKVVFAKLKPHLAVICEEIEHTKINDIAEYEQLVADKELFEIQKRKGELSDEAIELQEKKKQTGTEKKVLQFFVTSFSLDGAGENESIRLIGIKRLSTGEDLELKTPKIKWEGAYQFRDELRVVVGDIIHEVEEYMGGKAAPKFVQAEMEFDEVNQTEEA